ncbi:hypothetical protein EKN06_06125 [Croceicoccus ponticola]|uniref:Gamma-glutamylcyclotransferase n=1 Tax=Croceicoccus ponticola TaxID=2217664 RepID=A0A437GXW5_9SPHN|nr:hypothetical protein EKN06_06125 [Croceicoccus ponticola]
MADLSDTPERLLSRAKIGIADVSDSEPAGQLRATNSDVQVTTAAFCSRHQTYELQSATLRQNDEMPSTLPKIIPAFHGIFYKFWAGTTSYTKTYRCTKNGGNRMWVFGYGSLMWDNWQTSYGGANGVLATLKGYERSFNKASKVNWGAIPHLVPP